jgi:hypothetical protein
MIDRDHELPVSKQCAALGISPTAFTQIVSLGSPNVIQGLHRD